MVGSSEFDFRFDSRDFKAISCVKFADRPELVRAIALHSLGLRNHSKIEKIRNGSMKSFDLGSVVKVKCCFRHVYVVFKILSKFIFLGMSRGSVMFTDTMQPTIDSSKTSGHVFQLRAVSKDIECQTMLQMVGGPYTRGPYCAS